MTKTPKIRKRIEQNRITITQMLSGATSTKRLNNLNWLCHEIAYEEPKILFFMSAKEQKPYLDYTYMQNIDVAYNYTLHNPDTPIDAIEICKIHSMLCANTNIQGGMFRNSPKIVEITVNGMRMHAPDPSEIMSKLNMIVYKLNNSSADVLTRAFSLHYDLIALQPFDDFNKRTARLVMNWFLVQNGYRPVVFNNKSDKRKYIEAITAYANGDRKRYMAFMQACLVRTQEQLINVIHKSKVL
ncbi:MAG: Fic family protein [Alphaproteobacteria bacterium]|nr:Fic family protein [Alphaproteobacteria bacterium]